MTRLIVIALSFGVLAACVGSGAKEDELVLTVRSYENNVRWSRMDRAYDAVKTDSGPRRPPASLDNIRVTAYEQTEPIRPAGEKRYTVTAKISYVQIDRQVERTLTDHQVWEWDEDGKRWVRTNPIPAFK